MKEETKNKIIRLKVNRNLKIKFLYFISTIGIPENKEKTFLNLKGDKKSLGFIHKYIIFNAYKYGVPKIYIKECVQSKDSYNYIKSRNSVISIFNDKYNENLAERRYEMYRNFNKLIDATIELALLKNTRKSKIESLLEKIHDKNN